MKLTQAIAHILKKEGITHLFAYPVNDIIETAAEVDIRPIIVRQERTGLHMADAVARMCSGDQPGVFAMQFGPGVENSFGAIAQAFAESVPLLVLAMGYPQTMLQVPPNFNAALNVKHITKHSETVYVPSDIENIMRRAFSILRNGRGGPVLIEIPYDLCNAEVPEPNNYRCTFKSRSGPDPKLIEESAQLLLSSRSPLLYAGQGVHYARAWTQLKTLAEMLGAPVTTSLQGKSAFPEDHPLSLGSAGRAHSKSIPLFLKEADVIFGIGCSFTNTFYGLPMPSDKKIIHSTLDPMHLNIDCPAQIGLIGDAALTLDAIIHEISKQTGGKTRNSKEVQERIKLSNDNWKSEWKNKLKSEEIPLTPYRVISDLIDTVDISNTIITHDAGSPRDQLSPFWPAITPLSYIGWGKTTQLGYGLGLAMGAKIACPDKLCINVWGDAAIGFTGMDFETAVRESIPILSILFNNSCMACELQLMPVSTDKFASTSISGNYADMAQAFGGYGERITEPGEIIPAILRGIENTSRGKPALLEFITGNETSVSIHNTTEY